MVVRRWTTAWQDLMSVKLTVKGFNVRSTHRRRYAIVDN